MVFLGVPIYGKQCPFYGHKRAFYGKQCPFYGMSTVCLRSIWGKKKQVTWFNSWGLKKNPPQIAQMFPTKYVCFLRSIVDGLSVVCLWFVRGLSMVCLWFVRGLSMVCLWFVRGCLWFEFGLARAWNYNISLLLYQTRLKYIFFWKTSGLFGS